MVDDFVLEGKELYRDKNIRIHKSAHSIDKHDVILGENYILLGEIMSRWDTSIYRDWNMIY